MITGIGATVPDYFRFVEITAQSEIFQPSESHRIFQSTVDETTRARWREAAASAVKNW